GSCGTLQPVQYWQYRHLLWQRAGDCIRHTGGIGGWESGCAGFRDLYHSQHDPDSGASGQAVHHYPDRHNEGDLVMKKHSKRRGVAMVEFALAGIASATLLISTVQLSIAMWNYHTLAYATHETNRYISVHGRSCTQGGNTCSINVGNIATRFKTLAI